MRVEDRILFLKERQKSLIRLYEKLEDLQGEHPELYSQYQTEKDRADEAAELFRREIYELEGMDLRDARETDGHTELFLESI